MTRALKQGDDAIRTLEDLVTSAGIAAFRAALNDKSSWNLALDRAGQVQGLLAWNAVENIVASGCVPRDRFRVVVNGNELAPAVYRDAAGNLRADVVQGLAAQGATLAINAIDTLVPSIGELAADIERELRCRTSVNCYLSFGTLPGFPAHSDSHDVLVVQLYGAKRWRRFGAPFPFPTRGRRPSVGTPIWEATMLPGDLLFLPRGEVHSAVTETSPAVHLTFGLYEPTGIDFVNWLAAQAREVEQLRRGLAPTLAGDARLARDEELAGALRALMEGATIEAFLADQDRERPPRTLAPLSALQGEPGPFMPDTIVLTALRRRLDRSAGAAEATMLSVCAREVRLSCLERRALTEITAQGRVTVEDLGRSLGLQPDANELRQSLEYLAANCLIAIAS